MSGGALICSGASRTDPHESADTVSNGGAKLAAMFTSSIQSSAHIDGGRATSLIG